MLRKGTFLLVTALLTACSGGPAATAIVFSTWGSLDEIEIVKPLLAQFERENPDVDVELMHIPDEYPHKIRLLAASGRMPDVLFLENQTLAGFGKKGVLRDLWPFFKQDQQIKPADFYSPLLKALAQGDRLLAIPRDLSNLVIFYNQQLFDEAGLPYPQSGWTYEEMVAKARRLTQGDRQFGIGFSPYPIYWLPYLWSDGADVMDPRMTRSTLLEPNTLAALQRYHDLRWKYHVAPTEAQVGNMRMSQLFAQGKLAMMVGGRWVVPGFRKKLTFAWDVAPFPRGKAGSVVDADSSGWGISQTCRQPDKAWRLIRFLASKPAIEAFTKSGLIVPSRPDVAHSRAFLSGKPASSQVFLDVISSARPTLAPAAYDEIQYELIDSLPAVWNNQVPLQEGLVPVAERMNALLREDRP